MRAVDSSVAIFLGFALTLTGCELEEVSLAVPDDIPVVEAFIMVGDGPDRVSVFLHWTLGTRPSRELGDLPVKMLREDGVEMPLSRDEATGCLRQGLEESVDGVCYSAELEPEGFFKPGDQVSLEILLGGGETLESVTRIPEDMELIRPGVEEQCALTPGRALELVWSRSPGVWAYSAETAIINLRGALAMEGIEVEADSVALLGFAVSDSDTTLVFPREFGVFDRFDLEQDLAVALQDGLPRGAVAEVVVAALDRNYVNWVRGGNFNPSGFVRVSSIQGDGVGVFGSLVRREVLVRGEDPGTLPGGFLPSCFETQGAGVSPEESDVRWPG